MAVVDIAINFTLSALVIIANLMIVFALCYMKSAKRTTVVFLSQLAISNLAQGLIFFFKGIFFIYPIQTSDGCLIMVMFNMGLSGIYITGIFYVYLDLFLSLKKMSVMKPVISAKVAVSMSIVAWCVWLGFGALGYAFRVPGWTIRPQAGCTIVSGQYYPSYSIFISVSFMVVFILVLVCHTLTLQLMKKAYNQMQRMATSSQNTDNSNGIAAVETVASVVEKVKERKTNKKQTKWMKKNEEMVRTMLIVLVLFMVCWYPVVILVMVIALCRTCILHIPMALIYFTNVLVVTQYISNGVIYLIKIKEFKDACKRLFCFCCIKYGSVSPADVSNLNESTMGNSIVS